MREEAANILYAYKKDHAYVNIALNHALDSKGYSREDKDLMTRIVYGTIQYELYLDYQLAPYRQSKLKLYDEMVIKMSLYQLIFCDRIPAYAIIDEAVKLVKKKNSYRARTVNAILRNFQRNDIREIDTEDYLERLSIQYSAPLWLVKMLDKQYPHQVERILKSFLEVPSLSARINTIKATKEELLSEKVTEGLLSEDALIYKNGNIAHTKEYKEGKITIQDESSQLVARLLDPNKDSKVLDMCCAPGGKTAHLAMLMENTGTIDAYDLYDHKIRLVQENMERLGVTNVILHAGDSTRLTEIYEAETFDAILLDAPCSGLGVIGRKPEIKYQDSNNMDEIILLQQSLLENAYILLKKGGKMVYSTCTLNRKENDKQMDSFVLKHPDMKKINERVILPYEYHSDGFYMCKLIKDDEADI